MDKEHIANRKKGCFVDDREGDECVFDGLYGETTDECDVAMKLESEGKGKEDCEYWMDIPIGLVKCPYCDGIFVPKKEEDEGEE